MNTPACRTSCESMGVENPLNKFDPVFLTYKIWPMTFDLDIYDLELDPHELDLGPIFFWY